ncbi:hypothetical protein KX729_28915 [Rhizobium sp. XQZ8]|uniref:hypothetical protein n=1 Tax=Rhizobium populisoli TaxID=2859785 RepID=UPI001CA5EDAD|nr:hypothetical protein [Rhizobium populisoli]MBW6425443.1 hypothetical protein [Rhizobium populisoli]
MRAIKPVKRRRLIDRGIATVHAQQELLRLNGTTFALQPGFMSDMPTLARLAGQEDAVDVLVSAGMLMLAGEIMRLRILHQAGRE